MPPRLDPNTNTREEFTRAALQQPIPDDADPKWKELNQTIKDLMLKLLEHDAMRANKSQPFMTPAADKNLVYFLWDSTSRLLPTIYAVPPQLEASRHWAPKFQELWAVECIAKSKYIASLMMDDGGSNPLTQMLTRAMSDGKATPVLGGEINQLAQRLMDM